MGYFRKIIITVALIIVFAIAIQVERSGLIGKYSNDKSAQVVMNTVDVYAKDILGFEETNNKMLLIYDETDEVSSKYQKQMSKNLDYMKIKHESIVVRDLDSVNFSNYSSVLMVVQDLENKMGDELYQLLDYVEEGGNLLFGIVPSNLGSKFYSIYRKLGITEVSEYIEIDGIKFLESVMPGVQYRSFSGEGSFEDYSINLRLDDTCKVYLEAYGKAEGTPLLWERSLGKGNIVFYNGGSLGGEYYGGLFAGVIGLLEEDLMYPVINAKAVFIDDFPAPQYNIENDAIFQEYNRSIKDFYRDIWWPDMQKLAKIYNVAYTGLFMATYNDIVDPEKFEFEQDSMMQYYGKSLIRNNFEVGLHGYNHQSLLPEGYMKNSLGYVPWKSEEDMAASLKALLLYSEQLFPETKFTSYVPPSNYLSSMGRSALYKAVPDLKVISGVYSEVEEDGAYVTDFVVAEDGIVEFPRITSGMMNNDTTIFEYLNGLALHGVFSHFVHPDDILDEERGAGKNWEALKDGFASILDDTNKEYSVIRPLTATEASSAVRVYQELEIKLSYSESEILGFCENFYGEAFFYLRTDKEPIIVDESCDIKSMGDTYYFVTVKEPNFKIKLK